WPPTAESVKPALNTVGAKADHFPGFGVAGPVCLYQPGGLAGLAIGDLGQALLDGARPHRGVPGRVCPLPVTADDGTLQGLFSLAVTPPPLLARPPVELVRKLQQAGAYEEGLQRGPAAVVPLARREHLAEEVFQRPGGGLDGDLQAVIAGPLRRGPPHRTALGQA